MTESPFEKTPQRDGAPHERPRWDAELGQLWFAGKCLRTRARPARNQELILSSFEELGWPLRIDDPLPGGGDDPRARLHDAIRQLNESLSPPLIRFARDGSGHGIAWSPVRLEPDRPRRRPRPRRKR
jgi:hypothetical protein